jgi:cyanate permease
MLLILMDTREVDSKDMGAAGGLFFCVAEIGGFAGPFMMGVLVDATGTFLSGTFFLAGLCIAISGLTFLLKK